MTLMDIIVYICPKCGSKTLKPSCCKGPKNKRHPSTPRKKYGPVNKGFGIGPSSLGY